MNLNLQKGFGLIGIIIVVAVIAALAGGGLYWKEAQNQKSLLQSGNDAIKKAEELKTNIERQNKTVVGEPLSVDTSKWKMYRDEKYGFEVKYPNDVILEFQNDILGLPKGDVLTQLHIYDAGYAAPPGSTGAQVRAELREATFYVYRFSQDRLKQLQSVLDSEVLHSKKVGYYRQYSVPSLSGIISVYELMGMAGGYHYTYFSNNNYIFTFYTHHYDLGDQILSTLKFK